MRRRLGLGDLALLCAVMLLAGAAVASLRTAERGRDEGLAIFAAAVSTKPLVLTEPRFRRAYRVVEVCALHHPVRGAPADYRLCAVVHKSDGVGYVRRWFHCRLGTRCAPPPLPVTVTGSKG